MNELQMLWDVKIPMRDGIRLSAIAYLPVNVEQASPAIFALTPYTAQSCHEQGMYFA
jgi:predicted acyl esterase